MLYRFRFDANVAAILKISGYETEDMLIFWPVGATPQWVKKGRRMGWRPTEAAALGVSQVALDRVQAGQISVSGALDICHSARLEAGKRNARPEIIDHMLSVTWKAILDVGEPKTVI